MVSFLKKALIGSAVLVAFAASALAADLPEIRIAQSLLMNNTSALVPIKLGDSYVCDGYSLHQIIFKDKYELRKDGKPIAIVDFIYGKGGADNVMSMSQGNADMGIFSLPAALAGIDQGIKIKVISPYILAIGALTVHSSNPATTLDEFVEYIKKSEQPVKIGYHSPTSAPILILRSSMASLGLTSTDDPYDTKADILYVNLKGLGNMQASLASHQVEAFVGPDPNPQLAVQNGYGRILRQLRQLPPDGKWTEFPCCTMTATETFIESNPELLRHMVRFLNASGVWCTEHPDEASKIAGDMLGLEAKTARESMPVYLNTMTPSWLAGVEANLRVLDETGYLNGQLKNKSFEEVRKSIIDTRFLD